MVKYSTETKAALVKKVLTNTDQPIRKIAAVAGVPPSTLEGWVREYRQLRPLSKIDVSSINAQDLTQAERFKILVESSNLSKEEVSAYCRKKGLYREQLKEWEKTFMRQGDTEKMKRMTREIKNLRMENKTLRQEIGRKDRALAETTALLVLKKSPHTFERKARTQNIFSRQEECIDVD